ncbi:MAG: ABC transporter ATP-binding protein [Clostridiales bacterium]|nr:ABC transporter ATP-binding protein [Clostridiales bacterium]
MPELLEVRDLKKYFPVTGGFLKKTVGWVKAVDGVDLTIGAGETFGLVGESGCGKTTVGKLVLRLIEATSGDIRFQGRNIRDLDKKELRALRKEMQIIFQDPYGSLNPRMNIGDIVAEPLRWHRLVDESQVNGRVCKLLDMVGLNGKDMSKYPHEFSGGQRQRIVIARALAVQPKLIVCDEPVSALDVSVQAQILNLLKDLQEQLGMAYLFVAHGMPAVRFMSDRIGVMYLGKLVEVADGEALFEEQLHPYTKALMSAIPVADPDRVSKRTVLSGDVPSPVHLPKGCRFQTRCCCVCDRCRIEEPPLRQVRPGRLVACHLVAETP